MAAKTWIVVDEPSDEPPDCSTVSPDPSRLWPPNHKYRLITLGGATDPDGDTVTLTVTGVTQDEPLNGPGDGHTTPNAKVGSASNQVSVRAERSGRGDGRIYRIALRASPAAQAARERIEPPSVAMSRSIAIPTRKARSQKLQHHGMGRSRCRRKTEL